MIHSKYETNYSMVEKVSLGRLLRELHDMDEGVGCASIEQADYELLDQIREIRNYWCHQCYLDFHYEENPKKHEEKFQVVARRLHYDELRVYDLYVKIEKLRKSVVKRHSKRG